LKGKFRNAINWVTRLLLFGLHSFHQVSLNNEQNDAV